MRKNKKRLLSLLVAVAMVAAMVPAAGEVKATEMPNLTLDAQGYGQCPVCNQSVKWTEFDGKTAYTVENTHMHLYLAKDVAETVNDAEIVNIGEKGSVCFHLNGHTLTVNSGRFWLSTKCTDYQSTLNIIAGTGGGINFSGGNVIYQNYGIVNIYGGTYTPTDGTKNFSDCVTRGFTLTDAQVNADLISWSKAAVIALKGNSKVNQIKTWYLNDQGETIFGKVVLASNWTGSAALDIPEEYTASGKIDPTYFSYTGTPAGKLFLTTGEELVYRNGEMYINGRLMLDTQGNGECPVCNKSVKWTEFDGTTAYTVESENEKVHQHFYLAKNVTFTGASKQYNMLTIGANGSACFHLNGKTLTMKNAQFWLSTTCTDYQSTLNIIGGAGGKVNYSRRNMVYQNYGVLNVYGGTYTATDGKRFSDCITRGVTLEDAIVYGDILAQSRATKVTLKGKTKVGTLDFASMLNEESIAALHVDGSWSGSATLLPRQEVIVDGVLSPERYTYSGTPTGTLKLTTGEFLKFKSGRIAVTELQLNTDGYSHCDVCNEDVLWIRFDGTKTLSDFTSHQHFYLSSDTIFTANSNEIANLRSGDQVCINLNGFTLKVDNAGFRVSDGSVLNIIGTDGEIHYSKTSLIQQDKGTVNFYGGTYVPVYGVPLVSATGAVVLKDATVRAELIAKNSSAVFTLQGSAKVEKINLDAGGKLMLNSDWTGSVVLDMDVADLVGGKVPSAKVSYTGKPAGKVELASGKVLEYRNGVLAKKDELSLDGENKALCPMCKQTVKWTALGPDGIANTPDAHSHVYLKDNLFATNPCELIEPGANQKVCLHLNGYDLTTGSIVHAAGGEVNIYGYGSNYTFTGQQAGGNVGIYAYGGGTVNIYGGNYLFVPVQGAESTKPLVNDSTMRIVDATIHTDVIMDSNSAKLTLAGDTNIKGNIRMGSSSTVRGILTVDQSFTGSATVEYKSGLVSNNMFRDVRGSANGDYTGQLKFSNGKRLINNGGKLAIALVADPLTWKKLDSMPVANSFMTEEELRQLCVDFFRTTLSFAWTPKADANYQNKETNARKYFYKGTVYGGTPYVTATTGTVYTAMEYYDPITGTLNISGDAKDVFMNFSNQCSGSAFWAWNRVCTSIQYSDTSTTLLGYGCLRVGPYTYPDHLSRWDQDVYEKSTYGICRMNGEQTMFESYAQMKPADGILTVRPTISSAIPANGHNRMISAVPVVVRNADNTINGDKSYVYYIDQDGEYTADTQPDGTSYTHIGVDTKFTFKQMYEEAYIPFTFAELVGKKVVDESITTMDYTGKTITVDQLSKAAITSNYNISDVTIVVKDAAGNPVYRKLTASNVYGATSPNHLKVKVSYAVEEDALAAYADGNHTVEVSARIGTGEKPVVFSGPLRTSAAAKIVGNKTVWYNTAEEAIGGYTADDFDSGNYLRIFADASVVLTGGKYYIDAVGCDLAVTGSGTLYAFDSENADFEGFGKWNIADGVEIIRDFSAPDGSRYLVITEDGITSSHRLVLELAGVTLNTIKAGLSYTAQYKCDETLAKMIETYGIVASVIDMPGTVLERGDDRTELYTFAPDGNHEVLSTSSYVYGIFKESRIPADNAQNGKIKIYANPYIQLDADGDGEADVIVGDTENVGKKAGNAWSLYDVLEQIDNNWVAYPDQQDAANSFYNIWLGKGVEKYAPDFKKIGKAPSAAVPELTAKLDQTAVIISRLVDKPVTVEIGDTGVMAELKYLAWPSVTVDENGTIYAAASVRMSHVDPFGATAFFESKDGGKTWSDLRIIHDSPVDDRDVGLSYIGNGKMVATYFTISADSFREGGTYASNWGACSAAQKTAKLAQWDSYTKEALAAFHGRFVLVSEDYGKTWSDPICVPFTSPHGPDLMNDDKTLICSSISGRNYTTYISTDYGYTWTQKATVTLPALDAGYGYYEPHIIQLSDGSFLAGIRSEKSGSVGESFRIWTMKSNDGVQWTEAKEVPNLVGAPPHFLELANGAVLMVYSDREGTVFGNRGRISYDGGVTWATEEIALSDQLPGRDLGYPASVQLVDGSLITVFYQPYDLDGVASLMYTKWRLVPAE